MLWSADHIGSLVSFMELFAEFLCSLKYWEQKETLLKGYIIAIEWFMYVCMYVFLLFVILRKTPSLVAIREF